MPPSVRKKVDEDGPRARSGRPTPASTPRGGTWRSAERRVNRAWRWGLSQTPDSPVDLHTGEEGATDESKGESEGESKEGADRPLSRERASGRTFFFFFFRSDWRAKSRQARLLLAGLLLGRSPAVVELAAHPALRMSILGPSRRAATRGTRQKSAPAWRCVNACIRKSTTKLMPTRLMTTLNEPS